MAKLILTSIRKQAYYSVCLPLGGVALISLAALVFSPVFFSYSILLGGVLWFLPQGGVALRLFQHIETNPKRFILLFYRSEIVKLIGVGLLFIVVMKWIPANFIGIILGYLFAQVIFWLYFIGIFK
jgi:F0F1-type ATP synthase assembly protein I